MASTLSPPQTRRLPPPQAGYLYTPPEQVYDEFSRGVFDLPSRPLHRTSTAAPQTKLPPISLAPSPPTSPDAAAWANFRPSTGYSQYDAPLFPGSRSRATSQADAPLFDTQHMRSPKRHPGKENHSPESLLDEDSVAGDASAYFHERMRELKQFRTFKTSLPSRPGLDPYSRRQVQLLGKPTAGVTKAKPSPASSPAAAKAAASKSSITASPKTRAASTTTQRKSPKSTSYQDFVDSAYPSPQEKKHKRAAPTKCVAGKEDNNKWTDLADVCPPTAILDNPSRKLKVEWKHGPSDCSNKEDAQYLHPEEQRVASILRLEPRQYLANKRRIFIARLEQIKNPGNKGWNKTACQQACNIDVNKASQLYEAFLRIGWFDEVWFEKYL